MHPFRYDRCRRFRAPEDDAGARAPAEKTAEAEGLKGPGEAEQPEAEQPEAEQPEAEQPEAAPAPVKASKVRQTAANVMRTAAARLAEPVPGASILDAQAPSSLHLAALGDMMHARYGLYRYPGKGYAADQALSFHEEKTVDELIVAGAAVFEPSGGRHGSAKITPSGRDLYKAARAAERQLA